MAIRWIDAVLRNSTQTLGARLVLIVLADSADDETGACYPGTARIAQRANISERQVRRVLRDLEAAGDIRTQFQASHLGTNIYHLNPRLLAQSGEDNLSPWGRTNHAETMQEMSPKPSVKPSDKEKEIRARGIKLQNPTTKPPARDPWDVPDDIEAARRRREFWQAYCHGLGIDQSSPDYLAIESKGRPYLPELAAAANVLEPAELEEATRYLVARWKAGGIFAHPTITHAFAAIGEYRKWQDAGRPSLKRTAKRGRGADRPAVAELPLDDQAWNAIEAAREAGRMAGDNGMYPYLRQFADAGQISEAVYDRACDLVDTMTDELPAPQR